MAKRIFKGILLMAALSAVAVSCLKGGSYESSYTACLTFEEFDESYMDEDIYGEDGAFFENPFIMGDLGFNVILNDPKTDYSGFAISVASPGGDYKGSPFEVNYDEEQSGSGTTAGSNVFTVFHHDPEITMENFHHILFIRYGNGTCSPLSCLVNNTKMVADSIASYNSRHEQPLGVILTATGYADGSQTGSAEIMLAGARENTASETSPRDTIVSTWTPLDLSPLGSVEYIDFTLSFSDPEQTSVAEYFCMDDFSANVHILM